MHLTTSRTILLLSLFVLLGFGLRLGLNLRFQGLTSPPDPQLGSDHVHYTLIARNIARGNGFALYKAEGPTAFRPPGTPYLLGAIYRTFGLGHENIRIAFSLLGALTAVPLFLLARRFVPPGPALALAAFLAIYPEHAYYSMHFFSEVPWILLITIAACCGIHWWRNRQLRWGIAQGILVGIAALFRPIALLMVVFQGALVAFAILRRERSLLAPFRHLTLIFLPFLFCLFTLLPWTLRNLQVFDHFIPFSTHGGVTLFGAHNETMWAQPHMHGRWVVPGTTPEHERIQTGTTEIERDRIARELAQTFIRNHLADLPYLAAMKLLRLVQPWPDTPNSWVNWSFAISYGLTIPFILIGLWTLRRHPDALPLYAAVLMILANALILYGDHRFRISIAPILLTFACHGACHLLTCRANSSRHNPPPATPTPTPTA